MPISVMPTSIIGMRYNDISGSWYRLISFTDGVKRKVTRLLMVAVCIFVAGHAVGQEDLLKKGEELYLENRFQEALPVLESAVVQYPQNERVYLYLGTVYEELGMHENAIDILQRGTIVSDVYTDLMYFNMANNLFKQEKGALADEMYGRAIESNPRLSAAYLNRANNRVKLGDFAGAVDDYKVYLNLKPAAGQRESIERMIALLNEEIEAERERIRKEEEERLAEEARQRALLNEVLESLKKASEETKNLGVETEGIEEVETETDIVD